MAAVAVQASFMLNTGEVVDMKTTLTEGTEGELKTSTDYAVAATSIGTFANGKTITSIIQAPTCLNGASYAYVDRRGEILCVLPVQVAATSQNHPMPMPRNFQMQAGDTIRVMASTAASRLFSYSCITGTGVHAIFTGTPAGDSIALTHIKSGQGLGESLTGQTLACHMATSVDGSKIDSGGGMYVLNDRGLPVGGVAATNPIKLQIAKSYTGLCQINLNFVARVTTSA